MKPREYAPAHHANLVPGWKYLYRTGELLQRVFFEKQVRGCDFVFRKAGLLGWIMQRIVVNRSEIQERIFVIE